MRSVLRLCVGKLRIALVIAVISNTPSTFDKMTDDIYAITFYRALIKSFVIWIFLILAIYISFSFRLIPAANNSRILTISFELIIWTIAIMGLYIHFDYLRHSIRKELILSKNAITILDRRTKTSTEIKYADIKHIEHYESMGPARLPWSNHEYFCVVGMDGQEIIVPCYITNLMTFRTNRFGIQASNRPYRTSKRYLPTIRHV